MQAPMFLSFSCYERLLHNAGADKWKRCECLYDITVLLEHGFNKTHLHTHSTYCKLCFLIAWPVTLSICWLNLG